jgi:hypothetical protein
MTQTAQTATGRPPDIAAGGVCAWRLPPDPSCASIGRSLVRITMTTLGLAGEPVDAAVLAVSEMTTNALHHGLRAGSCAPAELWVWARTTPAPQPVVTVLDTCRSPAASPSPTPTAPESAAPWSTCMIWPNTSSAGSRRAVSGSDIP